ncbi:MAG: toxic anion resistance protein, partial [Lachnospiraceae bacterium]|nr:toxic anion resistance protein [Lachnospiraceae bacterium]
MSNNLDEMVQEAPSLTLTPFTVDEPENQPLSIEEEQPEIPEVVLTPQEQKMVDDFASQIDITNTQMVMQYGAGSQKKIADFSESALNNVRTKDMGEIGQMLTDVVTQLKDFDEPEEKGFLGIFKKGSNKLENMKVKYDKAENNINKICKVMESHQVTLLKDAAMLDKMYELNLNYFKELSMYILEGKQKLTEARTSELPALLNKAEQSALPEDTQAAKD